MTAPVTKRRQSRASADVSSRARVLGTFTGVVAGGRTSLLATQGERSMEAYVEVVGRCVVERAALKAVAGSSPATGHRVATVAPCVAGVSGGGAFTSGL